MKLGLVQPLAHGAPDDERNIAQARELVAAASALGAEVVVLPETYPGPLGMPLRFDAHDAMLDAARAAGVYVVYGTLEPIDKRRAYNLVCLADPAGERALTYRRTHPPGPWIYQGGTTWDFEYVAGDEFPVAETPHGVFGFGMCSEVYVPEVARALALQGVEVIFMPAGTDKLRLWATWRTLIWARAIENLALVVTTQNLYAPTERGLAMVAAPEEIVFETERAGIFVVDVDLARIRRLRAEADGVASSEQNAAKAGLLHQWRRDDLTQSIYRR